MSVRTFFFDEAGFTGYNLLDGDQPIFAIASSDIDPQEAEALLRETFPRYQGREFKFANIWGSRNRSALVDFGRRLGGMHDHAFTWILDKKFAVLTKIVDFLTEPYFTDAGYDFYADGFCWKYANYIHFGLTQFGPPALYESLVQAYQTFSRDPSPTRGRN
jgi:hypothetical protein